MTRGHRAASSQSERLSRFPSVEHTNKHSDGNASLIASSVEGEVDNPRDGNSLLVEKRLAPLELPDEYQKLEGHGIEVIGVEEGTCLQAGHDMDEKNGKMDGFHGTNTTFLSMGEEAQQRHGDEEEADLLNMQKGLPCGPHFTVI